MTARLLLVDSDIFVLMSVAGLLDDLAAALGFAPDAVRRLPALDHQLRRGRQFSRYDEHARQIALNQSEATRPLTDRPVNNEVFERLLAVDGIDEGEAFLITTLSEQPADLLTTGDGKALTALGRATELSDVRDLVRGRIVALDVALVLLVRRLGAAEVGRRFKPLAGINKTTDIFFRHKTEFDDDQSLQEITSDLNDLIRRIGDDLLYPV